MAWVENLECKSSAMWLHGPAGAGKSAITRSIAEQCAALNLLLASFFFSRLADGRNNTERVISTIAYQLAQNIPNTCPHIKSVVKNDPTIFSKSLVNQVQALIVCPLQSASMNVTTPKPRIMSCVSLQILSSSNAATSRLAILVVSHPEKHLCASFINGELTACSTLLLLDDTFKPENDIRLYLISKCNEIKNCHPFKQEIPDVWPLPNDIEGLVKKLSGQFIFVSVVVKYIGAINHRPVKQLQIVLGLSPTNNSNPFMELNALYHHILASADDPR
ncbi:hypothetical protein B0H34DRAFT_801379 [Crassisporium funariophilum]|nr:hypothetical protein B0H34DRAFT_801379 [Crassisporium funariophilum]